MLSSRFPRPLIFLIFLTATLVLIPASQGLAVTAIDCFSCHERGPFQKKVNHEPASSGECLSCHSPHVARYGGLLQKQVKDLCYSCHDEAAELQRQGFMHMPVQKGECLGCHNPHASDQAGLLKGRPGEICFTCHTGLPQKYKNTHTPYARGQCASCHRPHQSTYANLLVREPEALCLGCHPSATVRQQHPNFPAEPGNCGTCHNPHGSDRPALIRDILHPPYADGCQDCHTGKGVPVMIDTCLECHPEVSEQMASSHNHLVRYKDNGCMACHSPHAGDDRRLLKGKERHICGKCHEATFKRRAEAKFSHPMTDACNNCHAPHGSNHPAMAKAPINTVCSECHGQHGVFTHPIGEKIFDPRTGQMMTCTSCHATKGTDYSFHTRFSGKKDLCVQCHATY
jgi:predicted CXXCH cytochrome family protein